jgi:hypothetical protein
MIEIEKHVSLCGRDFPTHEEMRTHEDGCPACDAYAAMMLGDEEEPCCRHCGKPLYDFSDLGCGRCDRRSPEWGVE